MTEETNRVYREMMKASAFCSRCGDSVGKITVPAEYRKLKCPECGVIHYAPPKVIGRARACKNCMRLFDDTWLRLEIEGWEAIPAPDICDGCKAEVSKFKEEASQGGVTWYCGECGNSGIFKADSDIAKRVRKMENVYPPQELGVQLQGGCPVCMDDATDTVIDRLINKNIEVNDGKREERNHTEDGGTGTETGSPAC